VRSNVEIAVSFAVEGVVVVKDMHPLPVIGTDVSLLVTGLVLSAGKAARDVKDVVLSKSKVSSQAWNAPERLRSREVRS